jgi:hypothetical protein
VCTYRPPPPLERCDEGGNGGDAASHPEGQAAFF